MKQFDFSNKVVIVTAASRGIGYYIAKEFSDSGATVVICSRSQHDLERAVNTLGDLASYEVLDCFDHSSLSAFVNRIGEKHKRIDVLVNNFSGFGLSDDRQGFSLAFNGDLMGVVTASNTASAFMTQGSSIINITSRAADFGNVYTPYAAIKAAINQYTKSQAKKFSTDGIRVNAISPGLIEFPHGYWEKIGKTDPVKYNQLVEQITMKRTGTGEEVAKVALFLASELSSYVTGQVINVDGGYKL